MDDSIPEGGGGGTLLQKWRGARRTFQGFKFVDWYRFMQEIESESKGCR